MPAENRIAFTERATEKMRDLIAAQDQPELKLRMFAQGGCCSDVRYGFKFDKRASDHDMQLTPGGVPLLIDVMSFQKLQGAEVDYSCDESQFTIDNPGAPTACDCGPQGDH